MVISNKGVYEVICFVVQVCDTQTLPPQAPGTDNYHAYGLFSAFLTSNTV